MISEVKSEIRNIDGREVEIVLAPIGPVSIVYARTEKGLLACGAVDPIALNNFGIPTARVKPNGRPSISSYDDLVGGTVKQANEAAQALGIHEGMNGADALSKL